ncbi:MAG: helix-turn-helix domain-containing protein [Actinomycetota bacterium]|nr:helix-turn-helix domain-containing protein [Actinomycetota bacterium]
MTKRQDKVQARTATEESKPVKSRTPTKTAKSARTRAKDSGNGQWALDAAASERVTRRAARQGMPTRVRTDAAVEHYRGLLLSADPATRTQLMEAVATGSETGSNVDESVWGPTPTDAAAAAAEIGQLRLQFARRREIVASALTREEAAGLLDVSKQAILDYIQRGDLLGLRDGKRWLLPLWQFDADSERGFLSGIVAVKEAFPGGVVSLSRWITKPSPDFAERPPREAMAAGDSGKVVATAKSLTSAGW